MPLYWNLDSQERLLTAEAIGGVTRGEADALLDALEAAGVEAMTYRKLFDGSRGHAAMAAADRPMRMFREVARARRWIATQAKATPRL